MYISHKPALLELYCYKGCTWGPTLSSHAAILRVPWISFGIACGIYIKQKPNPSTHELTTHGTTRLLELHSESSWLLKFGKLTKANSFLGRLTKLVQQKSTKAIVQGIKKTVSVVSCSSATVFPTVASSFCVCFVKPEAYIVIYFPICW